MALPSYITLYSLFYSPYWYPYPITWFGPGACPYIAVYVSSIDPDNLIPWYNLPWVDRPPPPFGDGPLRDSSGTPLSSSQTSIAASPVRVSQQYIEIVSTEYVLSQLIASESDDVAAFGQIPPITGTLAATEPRDVFAGLLLGPVSGTFATTEGRDVLAFTGVIPDALAVAEPDDVASFTGVTREKRRRRIVNLISGAN